MTPLTPEFTPEAREKLESYLATHKLPEGMGTKEGACSIAAINLAMTGKLTDDIPDCMSEVLGKATIILQDYMPDDMRNSARYKAWLPNAAGTGRDREKERLDVLLDWMWGTVLPELQPTADARGFGAEWRRMCAERSKDAADAARDAAADADADAATAAAYAADTPLHAAYATSRSADYAAYATSRSADYAARAATAARSTAYADALWERVDPIGVLERMTYLGEQK